MTRLLRQADERRELGAGVGEHGGGDGSRRGADRPCLRVDAAHVARQHLARDRQTGREHNARSKVPNVGRDGADDDEPARPAHVKFVRRGGEPVECATCPVIWGESRFARCDVSNRPELDAIGERWLDARSLDEVLGPRG